MKITIDINIPQFAVAMSVLKAIHEKGKIDCAFEEQRAACKQLYELLDKAPKEYTEYPIAGYMAAQKAGCV